MTYGKIFKSGTCKTDQCRVGIDKEKEIFCRGNADFSKQILYVQASSLSICARSRGNWQRGSDSGHKDCLYSEAVQELDSDGSELCKDQRAEFERDSYPSASSFSSKRSGAWLIGKNPLLILNWNTVLIDCQRERLFKFISFWFPTEFGKPATEMDF